MTFIVILTNGNMMIEIDFFTPEHTVKQLIEYAIENELIAWPRGVGQIGYSIDNNWTKLYDLAEEEELGENCSLDPDNPSIISLERAHSFG